MTKIEIERALRRLGMKAHQNGVSIVLFLVGGGALALGYGLRETTRDVDALILQPTGDEASRVQVFGWIRDVGTELDLRPDWLNENVRPFITQVSDGPVILSASGITVRRATTEQLLAMKLAASRDTIDDADANALLRRVRAEYPTLSQEAIWQKIVGYVPYRPGLETQAKALLDVFWQRQNFDDQDKG